MDKENMIKLIREIAKEEIDKSQAFREWRKTDNPTDAYSVANRGYINMSGTVGTRPTSSVATIGQRYFATDTGIPMVYTGSNWRDGVGSVVAI